MQFINGQGQHRSFYQVRIVPGELKVSMIGSATLRYKLLVFDPNHHHAISDQCIRSA